MVATLESRNLGQKFFVGEVPESWGIETRIGCLFGNVPKKVNFLLGRLSETTVFKIWNGWRVEVGLGLGNMPIYGCLGV